MTKPNIAILGATGVVGREITKITEELNVEFESIKFLSSAKSAGSKLTFKAKEYTLEDGKIIISRVNATLEYPCKFMLVASMNPCPCGYYGSDKECIYSNQAVQKYLEKISGPLLDRIDI